MKTITLILAILIIININLHSQIVLCGDPNISNILKKIKVEPNDRYAINEAYKIKLEANKWLNNTKQMNADLEQLNQIAKMVSKFGEIKNKTDKTISSTQSEIIEMQLDAIESFELSNDIVFAFFKKYKNQIISKSNKENAKNLDALMKKTSVQWNKAKELRQKGYNLTNDKESIAMLVSARKLEDETIAEIIKAISTYYSIDYLPNDAINYDLFLDNNSEKINVASIIENNQNNNISTNEEKPLISNNTIPENKIETINNVEITETSHKIYYKIQVGAFLKHADESVFKGINPVTTEKNQEGFTRYLAGEYNSNEVAIQALKVLKDTGFNDAFMVTYENGIRLMSENKNIDSNNLAGK